MNGVPEGLTVAAAQPESRAGDLAGNIQRHADAVRAADARVVVFPELSLTGYELGAPPVALQDPALAPLVSACAATGSVALAGAPVADAHGNLSIATLRVDADGVQIAYRKTWLGGAEPQRFRPGDGPTTIEVDGWRLGLGICKDTGVAQHIAGIAALDVDAYLAGMVHHAEELAEQEARAVVIARACRAWVAFASFAGPTGGGFTDTAGCSAVWSPDGGVVQRTGRSVGEVARARLTRRDAVDRGRGR